MMAKGRWKPRWIGWRVMGGMEDEVEGREVDGEGKGG